MVNIARAINQFCGCPVTSTNCGTCLEFQQCWFISLRYFITQFYVKSMSVKAMPPTTTKDMNGFTLLCIILKHPHWLFLQQFVYAIYTYTNEFIKAPHHFSIVRGVHSWPADSCLKEPVMRMCFNFNVILVSIVNAVQVLIDWYGQWYLELNVGYQHSKIVLCVTKLHAEL